MKILNALFMAALLCGGAAAQENPAAAEGEAWKTRVFTLEELKKYDGQGGMPAYVAVDGIVYDFSRSKSWKEGRHVKLHSAGRDLSSELHKKAPKAAHQDGKIIEKFPKVGVLSGYAAEKTAAAAPAAEEKSAAPAPTAAPQQAAKAPLAALHKVGKEEVGLETSCPVTGEKIKVTEKTPALEFRGKTYYFSGLSSLEKFSKDPAKVLLGRIKGLAKKKKS